MRCVDLFCGFGGFTLAAEQAGARVVWAANHWRLAVDAHAANHPRTAHACADLTDAVDFGALPAFDVLLASPACQGNSQAAQPSRAASGRVRRHHDALRATAWAVSHCADVCQPRAIVVENVPDFTRVWRQYPAWLESLRAVGYRLQTATLTASIHASVPQRRTRYFMVAIRGRKRAGESAVLDLPRTAEPGFGRCVQWDAAAPWSTVAGASPRVRERIAKGRRNHGRRFLTQHVTGHPGVGLDEPIRTVTTKDQWAIVDGPRYRPLTIRENARAMGFPDSYRWPVDATRRDVITGLGNAVPPPLARRVIERVGGLL